MDFTSTDGTHYQLYQSPPYHLVRVISTNQPHLKYGYDLLNACLEACFQPITFSLLEGVYVWTPIAEGYIQSLSEEGGGLVLSLFGAGADVVIHVPTSEAIISPPKDILLEPALSIADQTSYFNLDNELSIGDTHLRAWIDNGEEFISIQGALKADVSGCLVAYNDEFITVKNGGFYKTFSLSSSEFNYVSNLLPQELSIFWDSAQNTLMLTGVKILKKTTPLHLHALQLQSESTIELSVSTLANPEARFTLLLKQNLAEAGVFYQGHQVQNISSFSTTKTWRSIYESNY